MRRKEAQERVNQLLRAGYYNDPVGLGFLILLYGTLFCCLPWLHFTKADSGHKASCSVPIVLFGTWDMYNNHWQGFLKFAAVSGVLAGVGFIAGGFYMILRDVKKWEMYELTLWLMKERRNRGIKLLRLDLKYIKETLRGPHPDNLEAEQTRGRSEGIYRLGELVQWAQTQEQRAAMTEDQARDLMERVSERVARQKKWPDTQSDSSRLHQHPLSENSSNLGARIEKQSPKPRRLPPTSHYLPLIFTPRLPDEKRHGKHSRSLGRGSTLVDLLAAPAFLQRPDLVHSLDYADSRCDSFRFSFREPKRRPWWR